MANYIIDTDDIVRTGQYVNGYITDTDNLVRTGEWAAYAITDTDDYIRTGEYLSNAIVVFADRPTPFVFTGEWPEFKPTGFDSAEVTNDVVADLHVRDVSPATLGDQATVYAPGTIGLRLQGASVASITPFAAGWVAVLGFDQQYLAFCHDSWESSDMRPFEDDMSAGIWISQTQVIRPEGIASPPDETPWPVVAFRTKTIRVRSIQSGHGQMGAPACQ